MRCTSNLKYIGLAFRTWATDNGAVYPMARTTNQGGSLEYVGTTQIFRHFQVLSNELSPGKILVCPTPIKWTTTESTNFDTLANSNIDYFVGIDSNENRPDLLLSGDRWLTSNISL
jgi:hypothetical protein